MKISKSITKSAQSTISVDGTDIIVASMNGTIPENGNINMSVYVQNPEAFAANKESVFNDVQSFLKNLYEMEE